MKRWIGLWNAYWFPQTTTMSLSVCRIVMVATQLFLFFPPLEHNLNLMQKADGFIDPQLLIVAVSAVVPDGIFFTPTGFAVLSWVTVVAGITALLGYYTRLSIFIFALGNWIFIAHRYSYSDIHHPEGIFCIVLMLLAFSPSGGSLSIDALLRRRRNRAVGGRQDVAEEVETAAWPLKVAFMLLALTYFSTGLSKLMYGGLTWMNGYTVQGYIFHDSLRRNIPLGTWVAEQYTLCVLLSIFTVLFELFFFVSLMVPRVASYFLISGILFQLGLYALAGHPFFQHIVLLMLILILHDPDRWKVWLHKAEESVVLIRPRQTAERA